MHNISSASASNTVPALSAQQRKLVIAFFDVLARIPYTAQAVARITAGATLTASATVGVEVRK